MNAKIRLSLFFIFCITALLFLPACDKEFSAPEDSQSDRIAFTFSKGMNSRANIDGVSGSGEFTEGDQIALYSRGDEDTPSEYQRHMLKFSRGAWTPEIKRKDLGKGATLYLCAFFPAQNASAPTAKATVTHEIRETQILSEDFNASDLLYGRAQLQTGSSVQIAFHHVMFRVNVDVSGVTSSVTEVKVRGKRNGSLRISDGHPAVGADAEFSFISAKKVADSPLQYAALIYPLSREEYTAEDLQVEVTLATGKKIVYKVPADKIEDGLQAGHSYTVRLKEKTSGGAGNIEFANKTIWVHGINSPPFPGVDGLPEYPPDASSYPRNSWFWRIDPKYQYISWTPGCGWYDCNKTFDTDGADDGSMCWAAAASNALHWWLEQNKDYVALYDQLHLSPKFSRPDNALGIGEKSKIFTYFIDVFWNKGAGAHAGINWFLTGASWDLPPFDNEEIRRQYTDFPGFFPDVLGKPSEIAPFSKNLSKQGFNAFVKEALRHHRAISFDVYAPAEGGNHAMTIWGVEFDEKGDISAVYYSNNNYGSGDPNGAACRREAICYGAYPALTPNGEHAFLDRGNPKHNIPLIGLVSLDLTREKWAEWARKNNLNPLD